jgi:predicted HTH transcriptional regulator
VTQPNDAWNEERIERLIRDKVPESLTLEYKASRALCDLNNRSITDLSKDVSSFANATGGVIIYGVGADLKSCALGMCWDKL